MENITAKADYLAAGTLEYKDQNKRYTLCMDKIRSIDDIKLLITTLFGGIIICQDSIKGIEHLVEEVKD